MLLSRKRARAMDAAVLPVLRRPARGIDETWSLRDLRATSPARSQVRAFLQRHNRADAAGRAESARLSSQELFLSVVLEWQRPRPAYAACSAASESESESEDDDRPARKLARDESPTSVYAVPQSLTPLRLDAADPHGDPHGDPHADRIGDPQGDRIGDPRGDRGKMIGAYSPRARRELLRRYMAKRAKRLSQHTVRYRVRKTLANARPRVKGRFVKTQQPLTAAAVEAMRPPAAGADEAAGMYTRAAQ